MTEKQDQQYRRCSSEHLRTPGAQGRQRADFRHEVGRDHHRDAEAARRRACAEVLLQTSESNLMKTKTVGRVENPEHGSKTRTQELQQIEYMMTRHLEQKTQEKHFLYSRSTE